MRSGCVNESNENVLLNAEEGRMTIKEVRKYNLFLNFVDLRAFAVKGGPCRPCSWFSGGLGFFSARMRAFISLACMNFACWGHAYDSPLKHPRKISESFTFLMHGCER